MVEWRDIWILLSSGPVDNLGHSTLYVPSSFPYFTVFSSTTSSLVKRFCFLSPLLLFPLFPFLLSNYFSTSDFFSPSLASQPLPQSPFIFSVLFISLIFCFFPTFGFCGFLTTSLYTNQYLFPKHHTNYFPFFFTSFVCVK